LFDLIHGSDIEVWLHQVEMWGQVGVDELGSVGVGFASGSLQHRPFDG
jgi:hypothetical protein